MNYGKSLYCWTKIHRYFSVVFQFKLFFYNEKPLVGWIEKDTHDFVHFAGLLFCLKCIRRSQTVYWYRMHHSAQYLYQNFVSFSLAQCVVTLAVTDFLYDYALILCTSNAFGNVNDILAHYHSRLQHFYLPLKWSDGHRTAIRWSGIANVKYGNFDCCDF